MARYIVVITALMTVAVVTGCDHSSSKSPIGPGDEFDGLRVIDDREYVSNSMREALLNQYTSYGFYGNGVDYNDQAPESLQAGDFSSTSAIPPADSDAAAEGREFTETNVQEMGVDESDRVKSNENYLYVLNSLSQD